MAHTATASDWSRPYALDSVTHGAGPWLYPHALSGGVNQSGSLLPILTLCDEMSHTSSVTRRSQGYAKQDDPSKTADSRIAHWRVWPPNIGQAKFNQFNPSFIPGALNAKSQLPYISIYLLKAIIPTVPYFKVLAPKELKYSVHNELIHYDVTIHHDGNLITSG